MSGPDDDTPCRPGGGKWGKVRLTVGIYDLRSDIAEASGEDPQLNHRIHEVVSEVFGMGDEITLLLDLDAGTAEVERG